MSIRIMFSSVRKRAFQFLKDLALKEKSPNKLALSFAMGVYIAICPFLFLHTLMIFVFAWLFRLNTAVTFATGYVVNNPFSMVPIFATDYAFGYWLLHKVFNFTTHELNPFWITYINEAINQKIGIPDACFWSFMVGGNIIAIVAGVASYFIMKPAFKRIIRQVDIRRKLAKNK
ncbi:DUF2062 domain-containing protein [bacterium]|nr:DUF2062 domain-containing protein [bacterium]